jgi:3-hydroxyacyl-[acyl-carrier-protein] dehydratase
MDIFQKIIKAIPYGPDFCFVDSISKVDENQIIGKYTYKKDLFFIDSHFSGNPLVPGVIMIETMGQIGMVCHLVYLTNDYNFNFMPVLSNVEAEFYNNASYDEELTITGNKRYFRHNILKSDVEMHKSDGSIVARLTANIKIIEKP